MQDDTLAAIVYVRWHIIAVTFVTRAGYIATTTAHVIVAINGLSLHTLAVGLSRIG